jgi:hypothetical protein
MHFERSAGFGFGSSAELPRPQQTQWQMFVAQSHHHRGPWWEKWLTSTSQTRSMKSVSTKWKLSGGKMKITQWPRSLKVKNGNLVIAGERGNRVGVDK